VWDHQWTLECCMAWAGMLWQCQEAWIA
jgi:hypothetical protein